jgi:hypothetical protein
MKWKFPLISGNELHHEKRKQEQLFDFIVNNAFCKIEGKTFFVIFYGHESYDISYFDDLILWMNKKLFFNIKGLNDIYVKSCVSRWNTYFEFGFCRFGSIEDIIKYWKYVQPVSIEGIGIFYEFLSKKSDPFISRVKSCRDMDVI